MRLRIIPLSLALTLLAAVARADWKALPAVGRVKPLPDGMELEAGQARVRLTALSASVVRVTVLPEGGAAPEGSFAVLSDHGLAAPKVEVRESAAAAVLDTGALKVRVEKSSARVTFLDPAGRTLLADHPGHPVVFNAGEFRVTKTLPADEHYFGLGDKGGPLDHRGQAFSMWNTDYWGWQESSDPLYKSIPFFVGLRGGAAYGLFLDNTFRSSFDFGRGGRDYFSFGAEGGALDYYFFYGPDPKKVIGDYTALTGRVPLPPLAALGFQQCRYSYYPEARVREIARELRRRRIPADVIYLDIDYQDKNRPFTIDRERFPRFEEMVRDLGKDGFKVVAITDLHLARLPGYQPYDEGVAGDHFVKNPDGSVYVGKVWPGDSVFPDFTRAASREWWGSLYREFAGMGLRGFWNDMNEPAIFERADKTMPLDVVHRFEERTATHREAHNIYGMQNSRATYEGLLRLRPDQRPFVLTRASYAGGQRYAATWTGDNSSTWNHLRMSVPTLLNLGLSGFSFSGVDIGGFVGSPPADLLTRWHQLGAFTPMFRNHTEKGSLDQEPWVHGPEHEAIRRAAIEERYRLMPYLYTGMEEASRSGVPLMRPMFLEFPDFLEGAEPRFLDDQFMLGRDLLVAARLRETVGPYEVALPSGTWYDYRTGERLEGGRTLSVQPKLDEIPLYVRGGAIIPRQPLVQHLGQKPQGPLELRVYPGRDCEGSVYVDDGDSLDYRKGASSRTQFFCQEENGAVKVQFSAPQGPYTPWWTSVRVSVVGSAAKPRSVTVNGQPAGKVSFEKDTRTASVEVPAARSAVIFAY